uniref:FKBP3 basic tilted helix bundle domain-containing protein n=1 Tax=Amphilophus citrinellus TaxID=61819 RepID=A0A3Q0QYF8_AMPCI
MAAEPTRDWSDEQLKSDDLPKKDIIKFLQDNAAHSVCFCLQSPRDSSWSMCRLQSEYSV